MFKFLSNPNKDKSKREQDDTRVVNGKTYKIGDGKIIDCNTYSDVIPPLVKGACSPWVVPSMVFLTELCNPMEVMLQAKVPLLDLTKPLDYGLLTIRLCYENGRRAKQNGDFERACVLYGRAIPISNNLDMHPEYKNASNATKEMVEKLRKSAIENASELAAVVSARFARRRKDFPDSDEPEMSSRSVFMSLASFWRRGKKSTPAIDPPNTRYHLIAENLQREENSPPHPNPVFHATQQAIPLPTNREPTSAHPQQQRRSSISKFDKDLPPPPKKIEKDEQDFSFNVEHSESPWSDDEDEDEDEDLPTYADVLLEAYVDDPNPPPVVLALRRGEVGEGDLPLLSGPNSSVITLNFDQSRCASPAPPSTVHSDSDEAAPFYSAVPSAKNSVYGDADIKKVEKPFDISDDKRLLAKAYIANLEKKRPSLDKKVREKATPDLDAALEYTRLFERDMKAALDHLEVATEILDDMKTTLPMSDTTRAALKRTRALAYRYYTYDSD